MSTNFLWYVGASGNSGMLTSSALTVLTTEIQSLATAGANTSSVHGNSGIFYTNNISQGILGEVFLYLGNPGIASALSNGANFAGWFLTSPDGSTFENTQFALARPPDFIIPLPNTAIGTSTIFKASNIIVIPALPYKVTIQNNTGQTSGNGATTAAYLKIAPFAMQY